MGIDKKLIVYLNKFILKKIKPDFTFLNIVNKKNLIIRLNKRKNKIGMINLTTIFTILFKKVS